MEPGPDIIYKCPGCGNLIISASLLSGNNIGAKIYSDGKQIAPMLPEFPELTKCFKCKKIFFLSEAEEIGTCFCYTYGHQDLFDINNGKIVRCRRPYYQFTPWGKVQIAQHLKIKDYFKALDTGIAKNKKEELFIRVKIWHSYNDRIRNGKKLFTNENDELMWRNNCNSLISLLEPSKLEQKIMIAELKRNLGDFDGCIKIINKIDNENYNWIKGKIIEACEQRNKYVILLNET